VERDRVDEPLQPDYNVAPTKPVYAVMTRSPRAEADAAQTHAESRGAAAKPQPASSPSSSSAAAKPEPASSEPANREPARRELARRELAKPRRELRTVRWGLVPSWAKDPSIGSRLINARAETVSEKPSFRAAFARRRCLLPADGYYEWQAPPAGTKGKKQPYFICKPGHGVLAFAGLYELWRDRSMSADDPGAWLWTTTIITTSAPDELGEIHDRMPMVIDPASWTDWLDPGNTDVADLRALLAPAQSTGLINYPVADLVNSVRNNGPELVEQADPVAPGIGGWSDA
jgi:putative SOS response-associated peptidase YedK